jgi:ubiquinone/menaquinone biosynthesis C-methylase UbiE
VLSGIVQTIPDAKITYTDGEPEIIDIAQEKSLKAKVEIDFKNCLSTNLPFPDQTFDTVFSSLFLPLKKSHKLRTVKKNF